APALDPFVGRAVAAAGGSGDVHLALWHGVNPALGLSLAVITVGALFIVARRGVDRMLDRRLFPLTGVGVVEAVQRAVQLAGRRLGDLTRTDAPAAHLAVPLVLIAGLGVTGLLALTPSWVAADSTVVDVAILVVLTGGVIATVVVRSRLGAVIAVGVAGFSVAVWFFTLGASDVALTQLLVEILTVVIMVLVLRHLPQQFGRRSARRAIPAAILAIAAGVVATLGTLVFTGRAELSAVGRWFVEEGPVETGGANVVNTILVEFRALDTFGELVVLAIAALAITALVDARPRITRPVLPSASSLLAPAAPNAVFINVFARVLIPLMLLGSLYALLRGHNAPGGGFIAALIGAGALATRYLGAPDDKEAHSGLPYLAIAGSGIVVAAVSGFIGYAERSFLTPLYADILGYHVTTSLIFDLGVYLAVLGVILGALDSLGSPEEPAAKAGDRR
uniref:hydrogen gas-evolving membrane-bound hydrogenase subunit E n=1 Tax=uncultured Aeromicrobium sp. TaxID=337820 RepID=UPI0025CCAB65